MKFPNAYKGVKKLFIAEICSIIAALFAVVVTIIVQAFNKNLPAAASAAVAAIGGVAAVIAIVAFIIQLVGLIQAGKDEDGFRMGFWIVIFMIILGVVSGVLNTLGVNPLIGSIFEVVIDAAGLVLIVFILGGISSLANSLGNTEMAEKGKRLSNYVILLYVLFIVLNIVVLIFNNIGPSLAAFILAIALASTVIEIVVYICIIVYEYKAVKMLEA